MSRTRLGWQWVSSLILCAEKGASEVHYALDNLSNKVLAAEYQTVLSGKNLAAAIYNTSFAKYWPQPNEKDLDKSLSANHILLGEASRTSC